MAALVQGVHRGHERLRPNAAGGRRKRAGGAQLVIDVPLDHRPHQPDQSLLRIEPLLLAEAADDLLQAAIVGVGFGHRMILSRIVFAAQKSAALTGRGRGEN